MAALTIRNVDDATKQSLRIRAAQHGVSMEEEARRILREALSRAGTQSRLGQHLLGRFAEAASEGFELPTRQAPRTPPSWDEPA
jgi:plasmid stability protein